jgi:pimeloyl-ACP methyl ester carboxylesterase
MIFACFAVALLVLIAAGYIYEIFGERQDARLRPPPGKLIPVGTKQLHLLCKGNNGPTVVIEQGAGGLSRFWWPVQDQIAKFAAVCTYDRAGYAWSVATPKKRTIQDRVVDLHMLLANAATQPPFILVAHSYGGLIVRSYAEQHPEKVAGLVLIDTPDESSIFRPEVLQFYARLRVANRIVGLAARFGILRLLRHWIAIDRYGFWLTRSSEYAALCDDLASLERVPPSQRNSKAAGSLGALPLVVITHGQPFPGPFAVLEKNWSEGQQRLARLSTDSVLIVAEKSNHMIHIDEPQVVIDAIRRIHTNVSSLRVVSS